MKKEPKSLTNRQVVAQSNSILGARYELTETEQKIILLAIAQVDSINDDEFFIYRVAVPELEKILNVELKQNQLKETCKRLMQRVITIDTPKGWRMFQWINRAEYFNGENTIEFKISDDIKPYLLKLKGNFTKMQLENAIKFNSKYTIRFYQFLMKLQNTTERKEKYDLNNLYELLKLPKSMRIFGNFKLRILDPSIKEINEKTEIKASYEIGRTGRKYTSITLSYTTKKTEKTTEARRKAMKKYTNKQLEKFKGVEFARSGLYGMEFYICKNFNVAPEINKERGDGNFCASVENGAFFYNSVSDFEADIKLAKDNQNNKNKPSNKSKEISEFLSKALKK